MIATARPMARLPAILFCGIVLFGSSPRGGARPAEDARQGERQAERLGRGLVALRTSERSVFLSWRLLPSDPEGIGFALDRTVEGTSVGFRIHGEPVVTATSFEEKVPSGELLDRGVRYDLRPVVGGRVGPAIASVTLPPRAPVRPYLSVPLETPDGYHPNDASVGDLDGDGEYEIVIHQVGRGRDNSQRGTTTNPILEAYRLDGTRLWRIDLGRNIREGAHYTQFLVWDFDGDGRAEVATKTADGTIDGAGNAMGDPDADWRNRDGYILDGPEFLTIFDGRSGKALSTVDYVPPRGDVASWGDDYGNRVDRFLACVAYLDGKRPSLVFCRGYYTRAVLAAFDFRDGKLEHRWTFDSDAGDEANRAYRGQGNHNIAVGDVDGDGRDEIVYGSCVIDDDGSGLYSTGLGHGDAMHLSDIDPDRPGLEVFKANGDSASVAGIELRDARTGARIWGVPSTGRRGVGRALALDIDPRHVGLEMWGKGEGVEGLFNAKGERIAARGPRPCNMGIWWDGDLLRELLDGTTISKWRWLEGETETLLDGREHGCRSNNGSKANPCLVGDILGDWREEVIWRNEENNELRIFVSTVATETRRPSLVFDPIYRLSIATQNVAYNQPPHPGFYLGAPAPSRDQAKRPTDGSEAGESRPARPAAR